MRVYQFMSDAYAVSNLRMGRLKVSFLSDMNDPFELLGGSFAGSRYGDLLDRWKAHMNRICRVLCFSRAWHNSVMWSHYGDKHKGMCLGFDVPDRFIVPIEYATERLETELEAVLLEDGTVPQSLVDRLLRTKFRDWAYEDEVRMFLRPEEAFQEGGLSFSPFSETLRCVK